MRCVLDTTAFSAAMRRDESLLELLRQYSPGDIVTVPPVVAEIQYGIERIDRSSKKYYLLKSERDRLLSVISVLPWSNESSDLFGKIKADLERSGKLIDDFDIAIAAIALSHKCCVVSANLNHFQRITNLESMGWKKE
jgi:tRNA(fMet)-specific endonuclease VapC